MSETRRFTAEDFRRESAEGFDAFGPDFTPTAKMLEQAAESERVLAELAKAVEADVRPEQAADYILSRGGFSEREIQIAVKVAVDATNQERQKVRAILGRVKP